MQYAGNRKVVIMQNFGNGNIEQAIFILRKNIDEYKEDYIVDEAKKIVDEFVKKSRWSKNKRKFWISAFWCGIAVITGLLMCNLII